MPISMDFFGNGKFSMLVYCQKNYWIIFNPIRAIPLNSYIQASLALETWVKIHPLN
jgi:hypothetical protein